MSQYPLTFALPDISEGSQPGHWVSARLLSQHPASWMVSHHDVSYPAPKNCSLQKWVYELLLLSSQLYALAKRLTLNPSSEAGILPTVKHKPGPLHIIYSAFAAYTWYWLLSVQSHILYYPLPMVLGAQAPPTCLDSQFQKRSSHCPSRSHCAGSLTPGLPNQMHPTPF